MNTEREYGPDISWIGEEGQDLRDMCTGLYIPLMSYPGAPYVDSWERNTYPDSRYFNLERFKLACDRVGWKYHGKKYYGRSPMSKWKRDEFGKDYEIMPTNLIGYLLKENHDSLNVLANAQKRNEAFQPEVRFRSPSYGVCLAQELYEAGWFWFASPLDTEMIQTIRKGPQPVYP